jgi:NAD(P)-dependent dehydrogenase (short-subunit alcohol dehydrogenase family)
MKLHDSTILITGAASGLGRELALQLAATGRILWLTDRVGPALVAVASEAESRGATAHTLQLDVTDEEAWRAAKQAVGPVDLLVNNAGVADVGPLLSTTERQWERQIGINLMGVVRGCRHFVPGMVDQKRGHVVNIASFAGIAMAPGMEDASPAMVSRIQGWMDGSGVTATDVAQAIVSAVERDTFMVLTHPTTRRYWWMKRWMPERYRSQLVAREKSRRAKKATRNRS